LNVQTVALELVCIASIMTHPQHQTTLESHLKEDGTAIKNLRRQHVRKQDLRKQHEEDQNRIQFLQQQLAECEGTMESLRKQRAEDAGTIESLRNQNAEDQIIIESLRKQSRKHTAEYQGIIGCLQKQQAKDQGTIKSLRKQNAILHSLRKQTNSEDQAIMERLQKSNGQDQTTIDSLQKQNAELSKEVEDQRCGADLLDKLSGGNFFETVTAAARERKELEQLAAKIQEELQGSPHPDPSRLQQLVSKDNQGTFEETFTWLHVEEDKDMLAPLCDAAHDARKQVKEEEGQFQNQASDLLNEVYRLCLPEEAKALKALQKEHIERLQTKSVKVAETVESDPRWKFNDTILREEKYDVQKMSRAEKQQAWTDEHVHRVRDRQHFAKHAGECLLQSVNRVEGSLVQEAHSKLKKLHSIHDSARTNFAIRSKEADEGNKRAHDVIQKLGKSNSLARSLYNDCGIELSSVRKQLQDVENNIQEVLTKTLVAIKQANKMASQMCFYRCRRIELCSVKEDTHKREKACKEELFHTLQAWTDVEVEAKTCHNHVRETIEHHANDINQQMKEYTEAADLTCNVVVAVLRRVAEEFNQEETYLKSNIERVGLLVKGQGAGQFDLPATCMFEKGEKKHRLEKLKAELTVLQQRHQSIRLLQKEVQDTSQKFCDLDGNTCPFLQESMEPSINEAEDSYEQFDLWPSCEVKQVHSPAVLSENVAKEEMARMADHFATELNKLAIKLHMVEQQNQVLSAQLTNRRDYAPSVLSITAHSYDAEQLESAGMREAVPVQLYDGDTEDGEATGVRRGTSASSCTSAS